jgi:hypothetical protein
MSHQAFQEAQFLTLWHVKGRITCIPQLKYIKSTLDQATKAQRWISSIRSLTSALDGGGQRHAPAALPPRKNQ